MKSSESAEAAGRTTAHTTQQLSMAEFAGFRNAGARHRLLLIKKPCRPKQKAAGQMGQILLCVAPKQAKNNVEQTPMR
jgi:hypothetical protein